MKLNSAQLEAFQVAARMLNFTRAAAFLHITQSALSQRISKLEDELGTALFIRDRTSVRLTEAGQQTLRFCRLHETAESELLGRLKGQRGGFGGVLRVGGFSSVNRSLVLPALAGLLGAHPALSFQLFTREMGELDSLLKSSEADYILMSRRSGSAEIESLFLGVEESVMVRSKKATKVEGIYLDHDENDEVTRNYFRQNKLAFNPKGMRYLDDVYGLLDGVRAGYGMAVLPLHLISDVKDLEPVHPSRKFRVPVYLQYFALPYYRPLHAQVVEAIRSHFKSKLSQSPVS